MQVGVQVGGSQASGGAVVLSNAFTFKEKKMQTIAAIENPSIQSAAAGAADASSAGFALQSATVIVGDIQVSAKSQQQIAQSISGVNRAVFKLEKLEAEREHWEAHELASSHKRLYSLLTSCYEFYLDMKLSPSKEERDDLRKGLETFVLTRGYRMKLDATHDMNKVVKSVFGNIDRRRVSAYGLALRAALSAGPLDGNGKATAISANALADWLSQQGGVEEVRLGCRNKGMTATQRADVAKAALSTSTLETLKLDPRRIAFDTNDADKMMVLVVTYRPTGELEVNAVVKSDAAVRAVLASHYSANKEAVTEAANKVSSDPVFVRATEIALRDQGVAN